MIERDREWIMERLVIRLYEPLPPEEEAEVEAYLNIHPEAVEIAAQYLRIAEELRAGERDVLPLADGEIQAMTTAYRAQLKQEAATKPSRLGRWLITTAAAASILVLLTTQGLVVQVGTVRVALGNVPEITPEPVPVTEEQLKQQVTAILEPYMEAVLVSSEQHTKEVETLYRLFRIMSQQRERDREELRNTFIRLTKEGLPGTNLVYAPIPLQDEKSNKNRNENQPNQRVNN